MKSSESLRYLFLNINFEFAIIKSKKLILYKSSGNSKISMAVKSAQTHSPSRVQNDYP